MWKRVRSRLKFIKAKHREQSSPCASALGSASCLSIFAGEIARENSRPYATSGACATIPAAPITTAPDKRQFTRQLATLFLAVMFQLMQVGCLSGGQTTTITGAVSSSSTTSLVPANISVITGNNQTGSVGAPLPGQFIVAVKDSSGNPVSGATVTWAVTAGGGSLSNASSITDQSGLAQDLLILGTVPGANSITATVQGTSFTTSFNSTAVAGAPLNITISAGNGQSASVGSALSIPLGVLVTDSYGNSVSNSTVIWTVLTGGASLSSQANVTGTSGIATANITLGTLPGSSQISAAISGGSGQVIFTETGVVGAAATLAISSGNNQTGNAAAALSAPFVVSVTDSFGNLLTGTTVAWSVTSGAGTLSSASNTTTSGLSSSTLTLGATPGTNTVKASITSPSLSVSFTATGTLTAAFQGWNNVQSLGGRTPVAQASGLPTTSASVTLGWNAMTVTSGTIASYNIYRSTTSGGQSFSLPLASGITTGTASYTDTAVATNTTYYYVVRPVVAGTAYSTPDVDTEIKIMVPPANMSLVHRWMANYEMCTNLMGRTIDRTHNYRCPYVGPINVGGYYDFGQNQFWDTVGVGCNYTPPNTTASLSCGDTTNGCLQITSGSPNTTTYSPTTYAGQVLYDRGGNQCYVASGGAWVAANSASAAQLALMISRLPGLPPLVNINQTQSQLACQQLTIPGIGSESLPKHSEQVIAAAWPISTTDATISTIENGTSLNTTGYCNSNSGSGLTYDNNTTPANLETIPGSLTSADKAVRTGSTSTHNCVSLYGIQDVAGNIWQWSSDQIGCSTATHTCTSTAVSSIASSNSDWYFANGTQLINFDGIISPGGTTAAQTGPNYTTYWSFSAGTSAATSFGGTDFLPPLGLPLVGSVSSNYDSMAIGSSTGQFNSTKFHNDAIWIYTDNGNSTRGAIAGGSWYDGTEAGRFTLYLGFIPSYTYYNLGPSHCRAPAGF